MVPSSDPFFKFFKFCMVFKHRFHILHFPNSTGLFTNPTGRHYTKYRFSPHIVRGASSTNENYRVGLAPEINRQRSRAPLWGRRHGAPVPVAPEGEKEKREMSTSQQRDKKRLLDGGGGSPRSLYKGKPCPLQNIEASIGAGSYGGRPSVGAMSPSMHWAIVR